MTIEQRIRRHIDAAAPAITLDEVIGSDVIDPDGVSTEQARSSVPRWAKSTAAVAAVLVGATVMVGIVSDPLGEDVNVDAGDRWSAADAANAIVGTWEVVADLDSVFVPSDVADTQGGLTGTSSISVSAVTSTADGFVAVGRETVGFGARSAVWSSPDGLNWVRLDADSEAFGDPDVERGDIAHSGIAMTDIAASGPILVAVGEETSDDTWTAIAWRSTPDRGWERFSLPGSPEGQFTMTGVVPTSTGFTAVGIDSRHVRDGLEDQVMVWTSPDGADWSLTTAGFGPGDLIHSMEIVGDRIIAVGSSGGSSRPLAAAWTSDDGGRSWDPSSVPRATADRPVSHMVDVAGGPAGLVAVGHHAGSGETSWTEEEDGTRSLGNQQDTVLWSSTDGRTWRLAADLRSPDQLTIDPAVVWGRAGYLVTFMTITTTGIRASSWITIDGTQPRQIDHPSGQAHQIIAATADRYIAITRSLPEFTGPPLGGNPPPPPLQVWQLPVS